MKSIEPAHNKTYRDNTNELYTGIIIAVVILSIVSLVLFNQIVSGLKVGSGLSGDNILRSGLLIASIFAAFSCIRAIITINKINKKIVTNTKNNFDDFVTFAAPLVQEVIVARITNEKLIEKLDVLKALINYRTSKKAFDRENFNWGEFLMGVGLLGSVTMGLFVFLDRHPFGLVPYSLIILAFAWYVIITNFFGGWDDTRSYYIPAIFILIVPSLSIALRAVFDYNQALYYIFIIFLFYVYSLYSYIKYIKTGLLPKVFQDIVDRATEMVLKEDENEEKAVLEKEAHSVLYRVLSHIRARQKPPDSIYEEIKPGVFSSFINKLGRIYQTISHFIIPGTSTVWPAVSYKIGRITLFAGLIAILSGIAGVLLALPVLNPETYIEFLALGLILFVSGFSLKYRTGAPFFRLNTIGFLLGILLGVEGVLLFYSFTLEELIQNINQVVFLYAGGLSIIVISTIYAVKTRHNS